MNNVDVDEESVVRFILSLPGNPDGTQLRVNGKALFNLFPVGASEVSPTETWTRELNARRCQLIEQELQGKITSAEMVELEELQFRLRRYRRLVTPLPLNES